MVGQHFLEQHQAMVDQAHKALDLYYQIFKLNTDKINQKRVLFPVLFNDYNSNLTDYNFMFGVVNGKIYFRCKNFFDLFYLNNEDIDHQAQRLIGEDYVRPERLSSK